MNHQQTNTLKQMDIMVWSATKAMPGAKVMLQYSVYPLNTDNIYVVLQDASSMVDWQITLFHKMLAAVGLYPQPEISSPQWNASSQCVLMATNEEIGSAIGIVSENIHKIMHPSELLDAESKRAAWLQLQQFAQRIKKW